MAGLFGGGEGGGGFMDLLSNRNFQSLLAGMGTQIDPEGVGGAVGRPTQSLIQSLAAQETAGKQEGKREEFNKQILSILGGFTPKEMAGPTSMKIDGDKMTLDMTRPPSGLGPTGTQPEIAVPKTGGGSDFKLGDLLGF